MQAARRFEVEPHNTSVQHFDRIAFVQHAFYHDRTVNACHALMCLVSLAFSQ